MSEQKTLREIVDFARCYELGTVEGNAIADWIEMKYLSSPAPIPEQVAQAMPSDAARELELDRIALYWEDQSRRGCVDAFQCALREAWNCALATQSAKQSNFQEENRQLRERIEDMTTAANQCINDAIGQSAKQGAQPSAWISVDNALPADGAEVMICGDKRHDEGKYQAVSKYLGGFFFDDDHEEDGEYINVTHWQPLQSLPDVAPDDAACRLRNQALEDAATACDEHYAARAAQGFPREASTARALGMRIRALKSERTEQSVKQVLVAQEVTQQAAKTKWRCFHCDQTFTDRDAAAVHFGTSERHQPMCSISSNEYREMERRMEQYNAEDAEIHREMYRQRNEHIQALRRAEEIGYAKGVAESSDLAPTTSTVSASGAQFDFHAHLARQAAWSEKTFGPGPRTAGVCDHIRKELLEIEADPLDLREWIDVVILALDGAWRCGGTPEQIISGIAAKQTKNEGRTWPDWRTADPNKAIEHDRSGEPTTAAKAATDKSED